MRRRAALSVASCGLLAAGTGDSRAPLDEERLNRFARAWNRYIEQLKLGVIDLKLWQSVAREWERLR